MTFSYTGDGQLYSVKDSKTGLTYQYSYDSLGRLMSSSVRNASGNVLTTWQTYDANNQLTKQTWQMGDTSYSETFTYGKTNGLLATHTPAVGNKLTFGYDNLQRLTGVTGGIYGKTYIYRDISGTDKTTTQVSQLKYDLPTDITYGYTYDALGNIATYTENGTQYTYTYDALNQLLQKTGNGKTYTYTYDAAGNILTASNGTTSHSYTYDDEVWKDLLKKFDGETISYDGAGNPTSYYNGTRWSMAWEEGRRLVSASSGSTSLTFTYDSEGLRLTKKVGSTTYSYYYAGGKLLRQTWGSNTIDFFYDVNGNPYALKYNGTLYYYITNLQGDVLHIVNTSGTPVVSYSYDPYGKPLTTTGTEATTLGAHNPLRYRGYVYDSETGLYYLQSRYYDPEIGRFINADAYASTGQGIIGCNMFAYCNNNPVNGCDPCGTCIHRWDFWNECEKCGGESLREKWNKYYENGLTAVCSVGLYGSVNLGTFNITGSIEIGFDLKGNVQLTGSGSFDVTTAGYVSASGGVTGSAYAMPDASYLAGDTYYAGGSVFVPNPAGPVAVGVGGNICQTSDGYWGINGSGGVGTITAIGAEVHAGCTTTYALTEQYNIFLGILSFLTSYGEITHET